MSDERMTERRLRELEGCTFEQTVAIENIRKAIAALREEIQERDSKLREWMGNGISEKIAKIAGSLIIENMAAMEEKRWEREREERRLQLEEQIEKNREYGAKRDAEAAEREKEREHRTKRTIAIVGSLAAIIGAVGGIVGMIL